MARSAAVLANGSSQKVESAVNGKDNSRVIGNGTDSADGEAQLEDSKYRDFFWTYTEEPHRTRRLAIIKAHPEVGAVWHTPRADYSIR